MGTKTNPGEYDSYTKAHPHEPIFTLRAKDADAAMLVKIWAFLRTQQIVAGLAPESDRRQIKEALYCATEMEIWRKEYIQREELSLMDFDKDGVPIVGPHSKATSGNSNTYGVDCSLPTAHLTKGTARTINQVDTSQVEEEKEGKES